MYDKETRAGRASPKTMHNNHLHEVAVTAIITDGGNGTYLITRRAPTKKRFPGKWTVPGGKLEAGDYLGLEKDTEFYWYNVLERTLRREVLEEVGVDIKNIDYLTSLATVHEDGSPSLVISCVAELAGGNITLQKDELDEYAWVTLEEAKKYDLIDGIYDELAMAERRRTGGGEKTAWRRFE
ncbi:MAG: NUDIX domain-containing protein [Parcubacteria group bacterium]|nr:NUDIX domain-containing protein [Parcubacteria group bacterium]